MPRAASEGPRTTRTPQRHPARDSGFPPWRTRSSVLRSRSWSVPAARVTEFLVVPAACATAGVLRAGIAEHKLVVIGGGQCVTGSVTIDRQVRLLDGDRW